MKDDDLGKVNHGVKNEQIPIWMQDVLGFFGDFIKFTNDPQEVSFSTEFSGRCEESAKMWCSIAKLRLQKQRLGFVPLPLSDYLKGLGRLADIDISKLTNWLGIDETNNLEQMSTSNFASFAKRLGLSLRETLIHIRISFAVRFHGVPIGMLLARERSAGSTVDELELCEIVLGQLEGEYDSSLIAQLRRLESSLSVELETIARWL